MAEKRKSFALLLLSTFTEAFPRAYQGGICNLGIWKSDSGLWYVSTEMCPHSCLRAHTREALRNLAVPVCHIMPLWFVRPFWEPAMGTKRHFAPICPPYEPGNESQKLYKWRWHNYLCMRHLPRSFPLSYPQTPPQAVFWPYILQFSLKMTAQPVSLRMSQSQCTCHAILDD